MSDYSESIQFVPEGGGGGPSVHSSPRHYEEEDDSDSIAFLPEGNTPEISLQQHGRVGSGLLKPTRASSFASMESIAFTPMGDASPNSSRGGIVGRNSSGLPPLTPSREVVKVLASSVNEEPRVAQLGMSFGGSSVASSIQFIPVPQTKKPGSNANNNSGIITSIAASSPDSPNLLAASGRSSLNASAAAGDLSMSIGAPSPVKKTVVGNMLKNRGQGMAKALEKDKKKVVGGGEDKKGKGVVVGGSGKVATPLSATVPFSKRQSPLTSVSKGPSFGDVNADDEVGTPISPIRRGSTKMATSNNSEFGVAAALASTVPMLRTGGGGGTASSDDDAATPKVPPRRRPKKFVVDEDVVSGDGDAFGGRGGGPTKPKLAAEDYMDTLRQFAVDNASDDDHHNIIDNEDDDGDNNATSIVDEESPHRQQQPTHNDGHQEEDDDVGGGGFEQLIKQQKSQLRDQGLLDGSNDDHVAAAIEDPNRRRTPPTRIASPKPLAKKSSTRVPPAAPPVPNKRSAPTPTSGGSPPRSQQHGGSANKKKGTTNYDVDENGDAVPEVNTNRQVKTRLVLDHLDDQVRNNDQYTATFGDGSSAGSSNDEGESPRDGHSLDPTPPRGITTTSGGGRIVLVPRSRDVDRAPQPTGQMPKQPLHRRPSSSSKHVVIASKVSAPAGSNRPQSAAPVTSRPKSATKNSAIRELCALQAQETNDVAAFNAKQQAELEDLCRRIYHTQCEDTSYGGGGAGGDLEDAPRLYERMLPSNQQPPPQAVQLSPRSKALRRSTSAVQHTGGNVSPTSRSYHHNNNGHGAWDGYGIKRPALYTHLLPHTDSSMASRAPAAAALGPHFGQFMETAKPGDVRPAALANGVPMWDYNYPQEGSTPPQKRGASSASKHPTNGGNAMASSTSRKGHRLPTHIVSQQPPPSHVNHHHHHHATNTTTSPPSHTVVIPPTHGMSKVHIISPNGSQIFQSTAKGGRYSHDERNTFNVHFEGDPKSRHHDPITSAAPAAGGGGGVVHVVGGSGRTSRTPSAAGGDVESSGRLLEGGFSAAAIRVASKVLGVTVWSAEEQRDDREAHQRNQDDDVDDARSNTTESDLQLSPMFFFSAGGARLSERQQAVFLDQLIAIQKALEKQERSLRDGRKKEGGKKTRQDGKTPSSISAQSEIEVSKMISEILERQRSEMVRAGRYGGGGSHNQAPPVNADDSPAAAALRSQNHWGLQRLPADGEVPTPTTRSARGAMAAQSLVDGDRRTGATPQSLRDFTQNGPAAWSQGQRQNTGAASRTSSATSASRNKPANRTAALRKVFNVLVQSAMGEDLRLPPTSRTATKSVTRDQLRSLRPYLLAEADGAAQEHRLQQPQSPSSAVPTPESRKAFTGAQPLSIHSPAAAARGGAAPTSTRSQRSASTTLSDRIGVVTGPSPSAGGSSGVSPVLPIRSSICHHTSPYVHLGIPTLPGFQCLCEFTASVLIPILLQPSHRCYHAFDFATFSRVLLDSPELARTTQGDTMMTMRGRRNTTTNPSDNGYESYFEALQ